MKRAVIIVVIGGFLGASVPWGISKLRRRQTITPENFDPDLMSMVVEGWSIDAVYNCLGEPLLIGSNVNDSGEISQLGFELRNVSKENAKKVARLASGNSIPIRLSYGKPKVGATGHLRYDVVIENERVAHVENGIYID
jgi:hypothetical protein